MSVFRGYAARAECRCRPDDGQGQDVVARRRDRARLPAAGRSAPREGRRLGAVVRRRGHVWTGFEYLRDSRKLARRCRRHRRPAASAVTPPEHGAGRRRRASRGRSSRDGAPARPGRRHELGLDRRAARPVGNRLQLPRRGWATTSPRIASVLRAALERNEAVIVCGGLGPTQDDLTREAIALVMDVALRRDRRPSWRSSRSALSLAARTGQCRPTTSDRPTCPKARA